MRGSLLLVVGFLGATLASAAPAHGAYDMLPGEPFAGIGDVPYTSAAPTTLSATFDTTGFTEDAGEQNAPLNYLACGRHGSKTAWVRFTTKVSGRLSVSIGTAHDVFFHVYKNRGGQVSSSYADLIDVVPGATYCNGSRFGMGNEFGGPYAVPVPAGGQVALYLQVLSTCRESSDATTCTPGERAAAPAGPTSAQLTFTPDDQDRDGTADSLDACPIDPGACPADADGDDFFANPNRARGQREDCNDRDPLVNPARKEIRGNGKDDDCDKQSLPFLAVTQKLDVEFSGRRGRADNFRKLGVSRAPKGLIAVVECRGHGCKAGTGRRTYRSKRSGRRLNIIGRLDDVQLAPGSRVTVRLSRAGMAGRARVFVFRKRGVPRELTRCTLPGRSVLRTACGQLPSGS